MKNVIKVISISVLALLSVTANAATINGTFGIFGDLDVTLNIDPDVADLTNVTDITLATVKGAGGTGDTSNVSFGLGGAGGGSESLTGPLSGNTFFSIAGWDFTLTSLSVTDQTADLLTLEGAGVLSGNNYDATNITWTFSTSSMTSYSMDIATIPVPAAAWLFGSGLLGLVAVARRKA